MKHIIVALITAFTFIQSSSAQKDFLKVWTNDGKCKTYPITNIDSITFITECLEVYFPTQNKNFFTSSNDATVNIIAARRNPQDAIEVALSAKTNKPENFIIPEKIIFKQGEARSKIKIQIKEAAEGNTYNAKLGLENTNHASPYAKDANEINFSLTRLTEKTVNELKLTFYCKNTAEAQALELKIPDLKFNKSLVVSVTCDDILASQFGIIHNAINNKKISYKTDIHAAQYLADDFPDDISEGLGYPLTYTDGCGNMRRFSVTLAISPNKNTIYGTHMEKEINIGAEHQYRFTYPYLVWDDVNEMIKFGSSIGQHDIDDNRYDLNDIIAIQQGFRDDRNKAFEKTGRKMKMMIQPNGDKNYTKAFETYHNYYHDVSEHYETEIIPSLRPTILQKIKSFRDFNESESTFGRYTDLVDQEMLKNANERKWLHFGIHRGYYQKSNGYSFDANFVNVLDYYYKTYGSAGNDSIWVANMDEFYEYIYMRDNATINKNVNGTCVEFTIELPIESNFYYPEISFVTNGNYTSCDIPQNATGFSISKDKKLINVNFSTNLPRLAAEFVERYEKKKDENTKIDAIYFTSQLKAGEFKNILQKRVNAVTP